MDGLVYMRELRQPPVNAPRDEQLRPAAARRFDPRHLLIALVAIIVSFAALDFVYNHALDSLVAFHLDDSTRRSGTASRRS